MWFFIAIAAGTVVVGIGGWTAWRAFLRLPHERDVTLSERRRAELLDDDRRHQALARTAMRIDLRRQAARKEP